MALQLLWHLLFNPHVVLFSKQKILAVRNFWYLMTLTLFSSRLLIIMFCTIQREAIKTCGHLRLLETSLLRCCSSMCQNLIRQTLDLLLWDGHHRITGLLDCAVQRQDSGVLTFPSLTFHHLFLLRTIWRSTKTQTLVSVPLPRWACLHGGTHPEPNWCSSVYWIGWQMCL